MNLFNNRKFNWLLIFDIKFKSLIGWNLHIPLQLFQTSFMYMCVCISCGSETKLWASIIWSNFPSAQNNVQSSQWVGGRITHKPTCTNVQALREKGLRYQYLCSTSCGKNRKFSRKEEGILMTAIDWRVSTNSVLGVSLPTDYSLILYD